MLAHSLVILLGIYLGVRLLVALYRWIDLWHTIRRDWPGAARSTVVAVALIVAAALVLPREHRASLLAGIGGYVAFYFAVAALLAYATRRMMSR